MSLQKKVALSLEDVENPFGLTVNLAILSLILLSSALFVAETYSIPSKYRIWLEAIDTVILIVFTIEYCLRLWAAEDKLKFIFSLFSFIDLIAIIPLLFGWVDIRFVRVFRWFRILRIIRFFKLEASFLRIYNNEDWIVLLRIFLTLFSLIFVYAGLIYQIESQVNSDRLKNFFDAFYFVVVTMTTVGYGDVTPLSEAGRAMTVVMILTGVLLIPWQFSELIKQVVKTSDRQEIECVKCGLSFHDTDAKFCKRCGTSLDTGTRRLGD